MKPLKKPQNFNCLNRQSCQHFLCFLCNEINMPSSLSFQRTSSLRMWMMMMMNWGTDGWSVPHASLSLWLLPHMRRSGPGWSTLKTASQACCGKAAANWVPPLLWLGSLIRQPSDACAASTGSLRPNADTIAENVAFWSATHAPNSVQ